MGLGEVLAALQVSNSPVSGGLRYIDRPGGGNAGGISVFTPLSYSDGAFHHFAIRKSGTSSQIFIDGTEIAEGNAAAGNFSGLTEFVIGQNSANSATRFFVGSLDDIRVYDSAIPDAEIAAIAAIAGGPFRITAFKFDRTAKTADVTFTSIQDAEYEVETSLEGLVWTKISVGPIIGGVGTTTVSGLPLPQPLPTKLLLRVRRR